MSDNSMPFSLSACYRKACTAFREAGLVTPELDARWLVAAAANVSASQVVLSGERLLSPGEEATASQFVRRRLAGEPVDRILGFREFWGLSFALNEATLSPRPDTETLVEACLEALPDKNAHYRLLDLGTGTGAILIALLSERPAATGIGVDISQAAVAVAKQNAHANNVGERACFCVSNWARNLDGLFDLVVSNPPYIPSGDMPGLDREVREHDPLTALDGGIDGLDAYRIIIEQARALLRPGATLVLELGFGQETSVMNLLMASGYTVCGPARRDYGGVARALMASFPGA